MNEYFEQAKALKNIIVENRRTIHRFAEIGFELPRTLKFVESKLTEYGLSPQPMGKAGIVCTIGKAGKTVLLRADMDALPMKEATGLPFAAQNGNCHSCGHDSHTAMLLGAAKLLKEHESELEGTVKLMFQPAEEILAGAKDMIDAGLLENPKVDAAVGLHVAAGTAFSESGTLYYAKGTAMYSGDAITITVQGRNAHGSTPEKGVDAINIAAHIVIALQEIISREVSINDQAVVLVGKISGGDTVNTLAGHAVLEVSVRAATEEMRAWLKARVKEIAQSVARTFRGEVQVEYVYGIGPLYNDPDLSEYLADSCAQAIGIDRVVQVPVTTGSEDFTYVAQQVPSVMFYLGSGSPEQGYCNSMHHPAFLINEDVLPLGCAVYAHCAVSFLRRCIKR
ncbi:M20 family metallopeptidase [Lachnospiraceae bacterium 54-53]